VFGEEAVEEDFVAVMEGGEIDVFADGVGEEFVLEVGAAHLGFEGADFGRQEAGEAEGFAFAQGEGGAFVEGG
jgi:hypothetical protein